MQLTKQILLLLFLAAFYPGAQAQTKPDSSFIKFKSDIYSEIIMAKRQIAVIDSLYEVKDYYANDQLAIHSFSKELPKYLYYKKQGKYLRYQKDGTLVEESYMKDDNYTGLQTEFFIDGKIYKKTFYKDSVQKVLDVWAYDGTHLVKDGFGKSKEYSKYHEALEEGIYKAGFRDSTWTGCYESGDLCYTETYKDGKLIKGTSFDRKGKVYAYTEVLEKPDFKDGIPGFYKFLTENLRYPAKAQRKNIEGRVYIKFYIDKDGSVSDAYPLQIIEPTLEAEAMRVVRLSDGHWIGGKNRALPVKVFFTLPVNFVLE